MANYAYYNGCYEKHERIRIPLTDRSLYFGDGAYEVLIARGERIYQLDEHISRLRSSCAALDIPFSVDQRELTAIIAKLSDLSNLSDAVIYIQVSRRCERRIHEIDASLPPNLLITVAPFRGCADKEVSAITVTDNRHKLCNVKSLNLLCSVLAIRSAMINGADCAIFLKNGIVTEEARSNLFIIRNGTVLTHPTSESILPGITRSNLLRACASLGIKFEERAFCAEEMISADEIFVSSTTKFIHRVSKIEGKQCNMRDKTLYKALRERLICDFLDKTD